MLRDRTPKQLPTSDRITIANGMGRTSEHLRALLLRLGAVLFALTVLRWVFYVAHRTSFPELGLGDMLVVSIQGLRFDTMTLVIQTDL